jgi:putative transposase
MPSRNIIKTYVAGGFYHIYNRGIEKRIIFKDEMDYKTFLKYLKEALSIPTDLYKANKKKMKTIRISNLQGGTLQVFIKPVKNFTKTISLLAYCLMPNHFHLLIQQTGDKDMNKFMQSVITRYSMYFNKKYKRIGKLFQGHYRAVLVTTDEYLVYLSRYIHLNPFEYTENLESAYSSYGDYLGTRNTSWVKPKVILSYFNGLNKDFMKGITKYKDFVEKFEADSQTILEELTLET